jgi:hypothetical protein
VARLTMVRVMLRIAAGPVARRGHGCDGDGITVSALSPPRYKGMRAMRPVA